VLWQHVAAGGPHSQLPAWLLDCLSWCARVTRVKKTQTVDHATDSPTKIGSTQCCVVVFFGWLFVCWQQTLAPPAMSSWFGGPKSPVVDAIGEIVPTTRTVHTASA
jgi:hypothetical protein